MKPTSKAQQITKTKMSKFKISGQERRNLKKILHEYISYETGFWHYHQLDKDMCAFVSSDKAGEYLMSDEETQKRYDKIVSKIEELKKKLEETV